MQEVETRSETNFFPIMPTNHLSAVLLWYSFARSCTRLKIHHLGKESACHGRINRVCMSLSWAGAWLINVRKRKTYETPWRKFDLASVKIFEGAVEVNERWQIQSPATFHYLRAENNTSRSGECVFHCICIPPSLLSLGKRRNFWHTIHFTKRNQDCRTIRLVLDLVQETVEAKDGVKT